MPIDIWHNLAGVDVSPEQRFKTMRLIGGLRNIDLERMDNLSSRIELVGRSPAVYEQYVRQ